MLKEHKVTIWYAADSDWRWKCTACDYRSSGNSTYIYAKESVQRYHHRNSLIIDSLKVRGAKK